MSTIEITDLVKSYRVYQKQEGLKAAMAALRPSRVYQKQEGLKAAMAGLFRREYREVTAVRGINMTVEQGEFVAFLGPNGAGKTTTLKLLSGVISPTSGTARVMGHIPWRRENAYRRPPAAACRRLRGPVAGSSCIALATEMYIRQICILWYLRPKNSI